MRRLSIRPRWRKVVAQILWPVPEAAVRVLCSPDDGCDGHPKHVESDFAINKYMHTVASCWILLIQSYDARNHEFKKKQLSKNLWKICQGKLITTPTLEHGNSAFISLLRLLHYLSGDTYVPDRGQLDRMGTVCTWDVTVGLHPLCPRHFSRQPAARVSQNFRPSYLSHVTTAAT